MLVQADNTFTFKHSFEPFLFNTEAQVFHQSKNFRSYISINEQQLAKIRWTIFHLENSAFSPLKAPFGNIEFDATVSIQDLSIFIKTVEKELIADGNQHIKVVSAPVCYAEAKITLLNRAMQEAGYQKLYTDLNQHILITGSFESHLHDSAKRRLKRTSPLFHFEIATNPDLNEIFDLIHANRQHQGHPLTISLESLTALYNKFKTSFITFTLRDHKLLIACSFGIIVNSDIIYYYLPADHHQYKQHSPMLVLLQKMYEYGQAHAMSILDLGISTDKGVKNEGLFTFKEHLGGIPTEKCTFIKVLQYS